LKKSLKVTGVGKKSTRTRLGSDGMWESCPSAWTMLKDCGACALHSNTKHEKIGRNESLFWVEVG